MKNKKSIYILLPIVLFIWGTVMYQFFSFSGIDHKTISESNGFKIKPLQLKERDTFSINVNYRDPFLGKVHSSLPISKKNTSKKTNCVGH
jgi:flagellar basal body-associated protein FliL